VPLLLPVVLQLLWLCCGWWCPMSTTSNRWGRQVLNYQGNDVRASAVYCISPCTHGAQLANAAIPDW